MAYPVVSVVETYKGTGVALFALECSLAELEETRVWIMIRAFGGLWFDSEKRLVGKGQEEIDGSV